MVSSNRDGVESLSLVFSLYMDIRLQPNFKTYLASFKRLFHHKEILRLL
jgi:hypothetical protein